MPPTGTAELLITREWAILADENDYTTGTFGQITGRPPRPVAEFLHQYRTEFAQSPRITLTRPLDGWHRHHHLPARPRVALSRRVCCLAGPHDPGRAAD
jgi:hypothetical protein